MPPKNEGLHTYNGPFSANLYTSSILPFFQGGGAKNAFPHLRPFPSSHLSQQEKKQATRERLSRMEAELAAASEEIKAQKEEELERRSKNIK